MADAEITSPLAPVVRDPERQGSVFEAKTAQNNARRGPLRFEEGVGTDPSVMPEFVKGISQGYITAPGRPNHNANVFEKPPEETIQERLHAGSAAWTDAPTELADFSGGASGEAERSFVAIERNGFYTRRNPATVTD